MYILLSVVVLFCGVYAQSDSCKCVNGINGRDGRDGMPGRDGRDCVANVSSSAGGSGGVGPRGPPGRDGMDGRPGPQGPRGYDGPQGPRGSDAGVSKTEIEKMVNDILSKTSLPGSGGEVGSSLKRVSVCDSHRDSCGPCKCRDKNYADEFFSRGFYCDCQDLSTEDDCRSHYYKGNHIDGVYTIKPSKRDAAFPVYCDMNTKGGGWVVIQRRTDGFVDFQRDWHSYKHGFGNLQHEFWLGLENMYLIQLYDNPRGTELQIDMVDKDGNHYSSNYGTFELGDESQKYKLSVGGYSGNGEILQYQNGKKFATYDNDNDGWGGNSAKSYGPFWHGYGPSYPYTPNRPYAFVALKSSGYNNPQTKAFQCRVGTTTKYITRVEMKIRRK